MSLFNRLSLDHFYISLSTEQINEIQNHLMDIGAVYEHINSGADSWKGYYAFTRVGEYMEILDGSRTGGFGMAFAPTHPMNLDVKQLINDYDNMIWKKGTRLISDKIKWFDWYSLYDYLAQDTYFNIWIMEYHKRHIVNDKPPKKKNVLTFDSIELNVGRDHLSKIYNTLLLPLFNNVRLDTDQIEFDVFKKDGELFHVKLNIKSKGQFELKNIVYSSVVNNHFTKKEINL